MSAAAAQAAHAVRPPIHAPAPPKAQAEPEASHAEEAPQRLLTSLSKIPAVQRKCAACEAEDEHRKMPVRPRLKVGPADDPFEREADDIAGRVMAMREPGVGASAATEAGASVQRACAACAKSDDEAQRKIDPLSEATKDEEETARMRADGGGAAGGESVAASSGQLTSGGAPLSESTRSFYESRMGRDLSDVRVHQGAESVAYNDSISSRAFTYKNHVWLGGDESAGPSFTMAHELAHVLQQTQPGPVGPDVMARRSARASPAVVQRNLWQPLFTKSARKHSEETHGKLQSALVSKNKGLVTEVRIPGAVKSTTFPKACGYADLYTATPIGNVPGVEPYDVHKGKDHSGADANLYHFRNIEWTGNCNGGWFFHNMEPKKDHTDTHGFPKVTRKGRHPLFGDCAKGPTNIKLGDVKPGHNDAERAAAKDQIENYKKGILDTARRVNVRHAKTRSGATCWNPTVDIMSTLTMPTDWDPGRTGGWNIPSLEYRDSAAAPAKSCRPYGKKTQKTLGNRRIKGRYSAVKDPKYKDGVWVYFVEPNPTDLNRALGAKASGDDARFKLVTDRLGLVFKCLKSTPKTSAALCRRPKAAPADRDRRTTPRIAPLRASPAPRTPVRKVKPGNMKKHEDKFDLAQWNAMRVGSKAGKTSKFDADNLKDTLSKKFTEDERDQISFQGAVAKGAEESKQLLTSKFAYKVPAAAASKSAKGVIAKGTALDRAEFWSGKLAGIFGKFRQKMGKAFGKTVELWDKFKAKAKKAFGKTKLKSKSGSALAVAAKGAASQVLKIIGTGVLRKTAGLVMGCLQAGFARFITKLTEETPLHELHEKANKTVEDVKAMGEDIFGDLEARAEAAIGPLRDKLKEIAEFASLVTKVVGVATTIAHGLRIGTCLSGLSAAGVGAAVTCLLSVGDFVLSLFNASPIDYLVSLIIKSCDSKRLIAKAMLSFDAVASLPTTVARAIVGKLRDVLPKGVQDVFCKPDEIKDEKISADEFKCNDPAAGGLGGGYATGTVSGGGEGGGTSPTGAKTPQQGDKKAKGSATEDAGGGGKPKKGGDGGGATSKEATTTQHEKVVVKGDPGVGQVIIESGIDPKGKYSSTKVDDVTITVNIGGHVFRNVEVDLVVVSLSKDGAGKLHARCYIQSDKKVTFRNDYEDGSHYQWSPDRGPRNQFDGVFRSSP